VTIVTEKMWLKMADGGKSGRKCWPMVTPVDILYKP
jgi:hypothetical protein